MVVKTLVKKILSPSIGFLKFPSLNEDIPSDLVPIGDTGLYTDIGQPVDPLDCRRYPGSIFCSNPLSPNALSLSIQIVRNPCNLGIKLTGSLAFIKMPPKFLVYRDPECRFDDEPDKISPDDLPLEFSSDCSHYLVQTFLADGFASAGYVSPFFFDPSANGAYAYGVNLIDEESFHTGIIDFGSFNTGSFSARLRFATFFQGPEAEHDYFVASLLIYEFVPPRLTDSNEYISWRQSLSDFISSNRPLKYYRFCNGVYRPTNQQKKPPPPPLDQKEQEDDMGCCPQTNALLDELIEKVDKLSEIVGVDEFPAELPKRLIYPNGKGNEKIDSLVELLGYQVKQIDRAVGYLPQKIKITDTNPGKPGNQSVEVEIHSFADFAKEVLQYLIDTEGDGDITNNMLVRALYELGFIHQGMVQADAMLDAVCEHLDFKQRWKKVKVPFAFDPYAGTKGKSGQGFGQSANDNTKENVEELLPKLLQNTEVEIRVLVNDEKKSLNDLLQDIKRDTAIAAAAVSDKSTPERLDQLVAAAQLILQLQSAIDRKNARQALTAGDLRTQKKK
ncbi:hypothetical protein [Gloeocapsopsis sp. IPPAS B-1203]|uniref:hypothetical protein n=1 Tax=Gloeocapsopsis sp. IPPAS B-1203 TaxID=2049454 RepID=UPI000C199F59|nr:hypothetical protein [Gloeocapsopsis sp. IPPAS B-1203]PIG94584.1 hypothetical protein CSQ79_04720 [Gloeocapsopsis sp. IPPAS B-1203]